MSRYCCTIVEKCLLNEGPNYILGFCVIIYIIYQRNVPLKSNIVYAFFRLTVTLVGNRMKRLSKAEVRGSKAVQRYRNGTVDCGLG